jgi:hypothetical protein
MDLSKLGRTELVLAAAGLLLFVFSLFPWYSISFLDVTVDRDAWSYPNGFLDWFPILLLLVYGILLALPAFGVVLNAPLLASPTNRAFIGLVLSAFAVLLFAIQGLTYPSADGYGGPSWAYFVSLVIALAAGVQSYLGFTQQGGDFAAVGAGIKARTQATPQQPGQPYGQQPGAASYPPPQQPGQPYGQQPGAASYPPPQQPGQPYGQQPEEPQQQPPAPPYGA